MNIKVGSIVAFNDLSDATWFDVIALEGFVLTIREHETNCRPQVIDRSLVKRVR